MYLVMSNINLSQIKSISSLPRDYVKLSQEAEEKGEVVFLKHNAPYMVLVDYNRWELLREKEDRYDAQQAIADVKQSEHEYKAGKAKRLRSFSDL